MSMDALRGFAQTPGGRITKWTFGAFIAAGLIDVIRDRDRTPQDMQGPTNLPGGNPYDLNNPMSTASPQQIFEPRSSSSNGVTYEVRTRGGSYDPSLLEQIRDLTGVSPSGSTYDVSNPFRGEDNVSRWYS